MAILVLPKARTPNIEVINFKSKVDSQGGFMNIEFMDSILSSRKEDFLRLKKFLQYGHNIGPAQRPQTFYLEGL